MSDVMMMSSELDKFLLRFRSLVREGHSLSFPCDAHGCVPLDALDEGTRNNYLFARICVGRDFDAPIVEPAGLTH